MSRARDFADLAGSADAGGLTGRNLIINGAMVIDQRNAITTANGAYTLDRWKIYVPAAGHSVEQSTTSPDGFEYSAKILNTSTGTPSAAQGGDFWHVVEGYNAAHLLWGTSNAKNVTLTFWVRSNKIGTYCLAVAQTGFSSSNTHSYVSEYTINTADTWEQKTIHIEGPTVGTWNKTTGHGVALGWSLGQGTDFNTSTTDAWISGNKRRTTNQVEWQTLSSADFYITGVQLEVGETATPFEHRSYGDELQRCQRYYETIHSLIPGAASGTTTGHLFAEYKVRKRAAATLERFGDATRNVARANNQNEQVTNTPSLAMTGVDGCRMSITTAGNLTAGIATYLKDLQTTPIAFSAEL